MQITMAGIRGSGKTCYLYATYNAMMDGMDSLFFNPTDHFDMLDLQNKWDYMFEHQEFPPGNRESKEYKFTSILLGKVLGEFTWYDYKGGLLQENVTDEYQGFEKRCMNSDCVVFAIPADLLKAELNQESTYSGGDSVKNDFRVYQQNILNLRIKKPLLPIVINITKGDLLSGVEMKQIVDNIIKTKFNLLFGEQGGDTLICRTCICTLKNLDFTPRNIHHPIVFPFYLKLKTMGTSLNLIHLRNMLKGSVYFNNGNQVW